MIRLVLILSLLALFTSCQQTSRPINENDIVLAKIDSKVLYHSDVQKLIHSETSIYDSTAIADTYIDSWIKDQLMIREAQNVLATNFEIEELVEDYRTQLIKYKYEDHIISNNLNKSISDTELQEYYEKYKGNYLLEESLYQIIFADVPGNSSKIDKLYNAWLATDLDFILPYCNEKADTSFLNFNEWINSKRLREIVPKKLISGQKLTIDRTIQKNIGNNELFFKILKLAKAKEPIPLTLIKEKLERLILHERKKEVIENYKQELLVKARRANTIELEIN